MRPLNPLSPDGRSTELQITPKGFVCEDHNDVLPRIDWQTDNQVLVADTKVQSCFFISKQDMQQQNVQDRLVKQREVIKCRQKEVNGKQNELK